MLRVIGGVDGAGVVAVLRAAEGVALLEAARCGSELSLSTVSELSYRVAAHSLDVDRSRQTYDGPPNTQAWNAATNVT